LDLLTTIKVHTDKITSVLATPDFFVSSSDDSSIKVTLFVLVKFDNYFQVFDYTTLKCVVTLSEHKRSIVGLSMNAQYLVSASFDGIKVSL